MSEKHPYDFVAIGGSSGALNALLIILSHLKINFKVPIGVVLHRLKTGGKGIVDLLQKETKLRVIEAEDKAQIKPGYLYLAPANYHMLVETNYTICYSYCEEVGFSRPSIDVFFESVAETYGNRLLAIILSGANTDGTKGMKRIKECGGEIITQNIDDAVVKIMPNSVKINVQPNKTFTTWQIANYLNTI